MPIFVLSTYKTITRTSSLPGTFILEFMKLIQSLKWFFCSTKSLKPIFSFSKMAVMILFISILTLKILNENSFLYYGVSETLHIQNSF